MNKLLPFLLITLIFLSACSSTQSLTNCPQFNGHKKHKHLVKTFNIKKDKRNKSKKTQAEKVSQKVVKRAQKQTKKIDKLSQKVIKQLTKRNLLAKLEDLPKNQVEELYESINKITNKTNIVKEQPLAPALRNESIIEPIASLSKTQQLSHKDISKPNLLKRKNKKQIKKTKAKLFHEDGFVKTHGLAIAALVCGILGLILSAVPFGILAIIFGAISKRKILEQPNRWDGKGMAQSGLIMGIVSVALTALLIMLGLAIAVL